MRSRPSPAQHAARLALLLLSAVVLAFLTQSLLVKPYLIPSGSMLPTLQIGQRVVVDRLSHRLGSSPHVGDIIVFHPPRGAEAQPERCAAAAQGRGTQTPCSRPWGGPAKVTYIKRVVGLPGDRIAIHNGRVIRNGRPLDVANATSCPGLQSCDLEHPITVPAGSFFVMGDNRGASDDSRFWGPVPKGWIIGRAFASYWPAGRIGSL